MSALAPVVALLTLGAGALGALRCSRELRRWLGRDPWRGRRGARTALTAAALALLCGLLLQHAGADGAAAADVVLALDVSRSMAVADVAPSRLRRATRLAERLLAEPAAARFGLVVFAGAAFAALPVSEDREVVRAYLRAVDGELVSAGGTDLARALESAGALLAPTAAGPRAIVLLSDGEHDPSLDPGALGRAAAALGERGVRVVAVAFGTPQGGALPAAPGVPQTPPGPGGSPPRSLRQTAPLQQLAAATGGRLLRELEDQPSARDVLAAARAPVGPGAGPLPLRWLGLAFAALAAEWLLAADWSRAAVQLRRARDPAAALLALALLALALLGAAPPDALLAADHLLEAGDARGALARYEALEQGAGASPATRLRIGNALYRLGEWERAAAAYRDALAADGARPAALRYAALFNLGGALLQLGQAEPARAALWSALRERPGDRDAQWNYEIALERLAAERSPEPSPPRPADAEADSGEPQSAPAPGSDPAPGTGAERRPAGAAELDAAEAERWLAGVEDALALPLREQLREALARPRPDAPRAQTW